MPILKMKTKPQWSGGRHPLARLHFNESVGIISEEALGLKGYSDADAIDADIDRAVASAALPKRLATRLKRFTSAARHVETLRADFMKAAEEVFNLYLPAELEALRRARRTGRYDHADLDKKEEELRAYLAYLAFEEERAK